MIGDGLTPSGHDLGDHVVRRAAPRVVNDAVAVVHDDLGAEARKLEREAPAQSLPCARDDGDPAVEAEAAHVRLRHTLAKPVALVITG
jgi:hypothetical protein